MIFPVYYTAIRLIKRALGTMDGRLGMATLLMVIVNKDGETVTCLFFLVLYLGLCHLLLSLLQYIACSVFFKHSNECLVGILYNCIVWGIFKLKYFVFL